MSVYSKKLRLTTVRLRVLRACVDRLYQCFSLTLSISSPVENKKVLEKPQACKTHILTVRKSDLFDRFGTRHWRWTQSDKCTFNTCEGRQVGNCWPSGLLNLCNCNDIVSKCRLKLKTSAGNLNFLICVRLSYPSGDQGAELRRPTLYKSRNPTRNK